MSDTPRTAAATWIVASNSAEVVNADVCAQLERELAQAKEVAEATGLSNAAAVQRLTQLEIAGEALAEALRDAKGYILDTHLETQDKARAALKQWEALK